MIKLTRLNDSELAINPELIEHVELGVNTVITLINGASFVVKEGWEELEEKVLHFKRRVIQARPLGA